MNLWVIKEMNIIDNIEIITNLVTLQEVNTLILANLKILNIFVFVVVLGVFYFVFESR